MSSADALTGGAARDASSWLINLHEQCLYDALNYRERHIKVVVTCIMWISLMVLNIRYCSPSKSTVAHDILKGAI